MSNKRGGASVPAASAGLLAMTKIIKSLVQAPDSGFQLVDRARGSSIWPDDLSYNPANLFSSANTGPFRDPVDWKAWQLLDYPQIIKHPMDLGTVQVLSSAWPVRCM